MTKNRVVKILMLRDQLSRDEAEALVTDVKREIYNVLSEDPTNYSEVEDIMLCELGLEMDYIFDIL